MSRAGKWTRRSVSSRGLRHLAGVAVSFLLAGCSGFQVLNVLTPNGGAQRIADLAYGEHPRQRIDLYRSRGPSRGVVVFFYGGGWESGSKNNYTWVISTFTREGFDVAIPDYRVWPEVRFPVFVEDGAAALAWLDRHGGEHDINTRQVWLAGHSAGAHIAAMLHFADVYLEQAGFPRERLAGFIGLAGAYDFLPLSSARLKEIFHPPESRPASQPVNFVDGNEPPALLIHGTDDQSAWARNTIRMAAKIEAQGGQVRTQYLEGAGHRRPVLALSRTFRFVAPVAAEIRRFLNDTAGG